MFPMITLTVPIKKAVADSDKSDFFEITYEGYGLGGIAVMVEALTDNRNRTAADVRHYFDKFGSGLGQSGCVSFMFEHKGVMVIEDEDLTEEKLMDDCLEAGAEDFSYTDGAAEITTSPEDFDAVRDALMAKGYTFVSAELEYVPSTTVKLTDEEPSPRCRSCWKCMKITMMSRMYGITGICRMRTDFSLFYISRERRLCYG